MVAKGDIRLNSGHDLHLTSYKVILGSLELLYSMDGSVGFLRFGEGTLATYGPGSSRIVKFQRNLKVLRPE